MATVGRVEMDVDFDGKTLPQQTRAIGEKAGASMGKGASRGFLKNFNLSALYPALQKFAARIDRVIPSVRRFGASLRDAGRRALGDLAPGLFRVGAAADRLRERMGGIGAVFRRAFSGIAVKALTAVYFGLSRLQTIGQKLAPMFSRLGGVFRGAGGFIASLGARIRTAAGEFDGFGRGVRQASADGGAFNKSWKSLPHGFRQFAFYFALFASLGSQISILGSAAGSGLALIAGAAAAGAIAVGALALGISVLAGKIENVPKSLLPVRQAFADLGSQFGDIRKNTAVALFGGLEDEVSALGTTLFPALNAGLVLTAKTLNPIIEQFLKFGASTGFIDKLNIVFAQIQPIIGSLASAIGNLGSALGNIFVIALPYIQLFTAGLDDLLGRFAAFTQSGQGILQINEFFANGQKIFAAIIPLISAAAGVLNGLVTPETLVLFEGLMANLTTFLTQGGAGLLGIIATLDPIGLIGQALADLSTALAPAFTAFSQLASILNGALSQAISTLAPILGGLVAAWAPILVIVAQFASQLLGALIPALAPIGTAISTVVTNLAPLVSALASALMPVLDALLPILTVVATTFTDLWATILPPLMDIVNALAPVFQTIVEAIAPLISTILPPLGQLLGGLVTAFAPLVVAVLQLLDPILKLISPLLDLIGPILQPLIELLLQIVSAALPPLISIIKSVLVPTIHILTDVFESISPVIENVIGILSGLIEFIVAVFKGDWEGAWKAVVKVFTNIFEGIQNVVKGVINVVIDLINGMIRGINSFAPDVFKAFGLSGSITIPLIPKLASGGLFNKPMTALIGEAGPEAVVPLNRPLSQVDPSVRGLSALLQGKSDGSGAGKSIQVAEGAILVVSNEPRQAATAVLDRFVSVAGE